MLSNLFCLSAKLSLLYDAQHMACGPAISGKSWLATEEPAKKMSPQKGNQQVQNTLDGKRHQKEQKERDYNEKSQKKKKANKQNM